MRAAPITLSGGMTDIRIPGLDHPIDIEPTDGRVRIRLGGRVVAESSAALTLREASYPPVQYVPLADVDPAVLEPSSHTSYCPFKGKATYYSLKVGDRVVPDSVWTYVDPHDAVAPIKDHVAFYVDKMDSVEVHRVG
jgi:uncharacterized protein (DUF427 family)